jgi:hypothetical protein
MQTPLPKRSPVETIFHGKTAIERLQKLTVAQPVNTSEQTATDTYPELNKPNPYHSTLSP